MNKNYKTHLCLFLGFVFLGCTMIGIAQAEESGGIDADATTGVNQSVVEKISSEYSVFLSENAEPVVAGLRTGNEITLTTVGNEGTPITTTFTPPTGKMGYGNISHAIGLAEQQLAQYGISEPTAEELQAALIGGDITTQSGGTATIDGVLTLRSSGMGWGEIAHEYGVKLGHVISATKSGKGSIAVTTDPTNTVDTSTGSQAKAVAKSHKGYGEGIVTGSGKTTTSVKQIKPMAKQSKPHSYGHGIVTASGASVIERQSFGGNVNASSGKSSHVYGHGVVTASGASMSSSGVSTGKSNGKQLAKGHSK